MKDFDTWFYVIAFVFYIVAQLYRGYKKNKNAAPAPKKSRQPQSAGDRVPVPVEVTTKPVQKKPKKRFSFDDLLKEFEESMAEKIPPAPVREIPEKPEKDEKDMFKGYSGPESYETPYVNPEPSSRPPLETLKKREELTAQEGNLKFKKSEDYKILEKTENPYAKILREPDGLKKAVILSEILNRKYF